MYVSDQNIVEIELQTLNCVQSSFGGNNWLHRSSEAIESSFQNHSAKLSLNPYFPIGIVKILFSMMERTISYEINCTFVFQSESDLQSEVRSQTEADR